MKSQRMTCKNDLMHHVVEGCPYSYDDPQYSYMREMQFLKDGSIDTKTDIFDFAVEVVDPLYGTIEKFHPFKKTKKGCVQTCFVGILYDDTGKCLLSLPKYIRKMVAGTNDEVKNEVISEQSDNLLFLMNRYGEMLAQRDPLFYTCTSPGFSEFGFAYTFLKWYLENGLYYQKTKESAETIGRTMWGRTVKKKLPEMIDESPIYRHVIKERFTAQEDCITQLQLEILSYLCNAKGYRAKLASLLNASFQDISDISSSDLNIDEILEDRDLNRQWTEKVEYARQQNYRDDYDELLKLMLSFLSQQYKMKATQSGIYGIIKYENLFEVVLGDYLGNQFHPELRNGTLYTKLTSNILGKTIPDINQEYYSLADYQLHDKGFRYRKSRERTNTGVLVPDIIFEAEKAVQENDNTVVLVDAKYYDYQTTDSNIIGFVTGFPENYDVTKQCYYEDLLKAIYKKNGCDIKVHNFFVIPWIVKERNNYKWGYKGSVLFEGHEITVLFVNFDLIVKSIRNEKKDLKKQRHDFLKAIKTIKGESNANNKKNSDSQGAV